MMSWFAGSEPTAPVSDPTPPKVGSDGLPSASGDGQGKGNNASAAICGWGALWIIGLILIVFAIIFLGALLQLWPPPKPREGFTLDFQHSTLEVHPGNPATFTILIRAHSGFSGSVTLQAVVLPDKSPDELTYAFAPPGVPPTTGLLVPSTAGSSAILTLQTRSGEEKNYSVMVAATGGGQTKTIAGRLVTRQNAPEVPLVKAPLQDGSEERTLHEGVSDLPMYLWTIPRVPDEVRLFLIVAVVGYLGGLLHSIRSFVWYAGHDQLERRWIPFYVSTPIIGMTMAILFYLLFRAGFISPGTAAAETNTYGFAAIAGLVGLFSGNASQMLENIAGVLFAKVREGAGKVSPGDFRMSADRSSQTVAPGDTATYRITVAATEDFSASVTLTAAVAAEQDKGLTVALNPTVLMPTAIGTAVTLTAATAAHTPPGEYKITITATGGGKEHRVEVILNVTRHEGSQPDEPQNPAIVLSEATRLDRTIEAVKEGLVVANTIREVLPEGLRGPAETVIGKVQRGLTVVEGLKSSGHVGEAIEKAIGIVKDVSKEGGVATMLAKAAGSFGVALGGAVPPLALAVSVATVAARLSGAAYERWIARVLDAPYTPALFPPTVIDANTGFVLLRKSPGFATVFAPEIQQGNRAFILAFVQTALSEAGSEAIRAQYSDRFATFQEVDEALNQFQQAAIELEVSKDLTGEMVADVGGVEPLMRAIDRINADAEARADMDALVLMIDKLRKAGQPVEKLVREARQEVEG